MFSFRNIRNFNKLELDELERVKLRTRARLGLNIDF